MDWYMLTAFADSKGKTFLELSSALDYWIASAVPKFI